MTHESTASITREREKKQEKEEGLRERKIEILFWFSSFILFICLCILVDESIFISFRCSFCTLVHLACELLLYFLLVFLFFFCFLRKFWWFVLTKMEILFWFSSFILSLNCNLFTD